MRGCDVHHSMRSGGQLLDACVVYYRAEIERPAHCLHPFIMAHTALADADKATGAFVRKDAVFRDWIRADAASKYPAAAGRYLLYVSYACPWASRCLAVRTIKGLEDVIDVAIVAPIWAETKPGVDAHRGWVFDPSYPGATADPVFGERLHASFAPHVRHACAVNRSSRASRDHRCCCRRAHAAGGLRACGGRGHRHALHRSRALRHGHEPHRVQRVQRDHPHVQRRV